VRAYATNSVGTSYGNEVTFTTPQTSVASLTTDTVSMITSTAGMSGGNITSDGGQSVTIRGLCWSTTQNPTISDDTTKNGSGTGIFSGDLISLTPNTNYFVRSYAINSVGTAYGNQVTFKTDVAGPGANEVFIQGMAFNPVTITVSAGTTITWTNKDGVSHTVTSDTALFDSGTIASNGTYSHTFSTAGTFAYHCSIHTDMMATVVVN
jgi:plastocyanin